MKERKKERGGKQEFQRGIKGALSHPHHLITHVWKFSFEMRPSVTHKKKMVTPDEREREKEFIHTFVKRTFLQPPPPKKKGRAVLGEGITSNRTE